MTDLATRARAGAILELLRSISGEHAQREGLTETPERVAKAWGEWTAGYAEDPSTILKTFDEADSNELVVVRNIPFYSMCEHHLAPFFGMVHIGYIPKGRVVGLSKLARLCDVFARRLQIQERMTTSIANALRDNLRPDGVGVVVEARHMCMESRGIARPGCITVTSALRGYIDTQPSARAEFLSLTRSAPNVAI